MRNTKWLIVAFSILLLVVVGEIIYYFFVLSPGQGTKQTTTIQNQPQPTSPSGTSFVPPINNNAVKYINSINRDSVTYSKFINVYDGRITSLENKTGIFTDKSYNATTRYVSILQLTSDKNSNSRLNFYFSEEDIKKMTVFRIVNGTEQKISYDDLKMNDAVSIEETMDTMQRNYTDTFTYRIMVK